MANSLEFDISPITLQRNVEKDSGKFYCSQFDLPVDKLLWFCFNVKPSDWEEKITWYPRASGGLLLLLRVFVIALVIKTARKLPHPALGFRLRLTDNEV